MRCLLTMSVTESQRTLFCGKQQISSPPLRREATSVQNSCSNWEGKNKFCSEKIKRESLLRVCFCPLLVSCSTSGTCSVFVVVSVFSAILSEQWLLIDNLYGYLILRWSYKIMQSFVHPSEGRLLDQTPIHVYGSDCNICLCILISDDSTARSGLSWNILFFNLKFLFCALPYKELVFAQSYWKFPFAIVSGNRSQFWENILFHYSYYTAISMLKLKT